MRFNNPEISKGIRYFELKCPFAKKCLYLQRLTSSLQDISFAIQGNIPLNTQSIDEQEENFIKLFCGVNNGNVFRSNYEGDRE
jgi:hypothetical protein